MEAEHVFILKVVAVMVSLEDRVGKGFDVDPDTLRSIVEFLRIYADRCHHGKEEVYLFTFLQKKGVPLTGCPLGALLHEHKIGREWVGKFAEAIEGYAKDRSGGRGALQESMKALAALYPNHIWKEDYLLSPMANKLLSGSEQEGLRNTFEDAERELGSELHRKWERFAVELEGKTGNPV